MSKMGQSVNRITTHALWMTGFTACLVAMFTTSGCGDDNGSAGNGGGGTSGNQGGSGPALCTLPSDCPDLGQECVVRTCNGGICGAANAPFGTPLVAQMSGDCVRAICDGNGGPTSIHDDTDVQDDGNVCTADACVEGVATHMPELPGIVCGSSTICDGNGACVACLSDDDCKSGSICASSSCVAPTCIDGFVNGSESDLDCGGPACAPCAAEKKCASSTDCASGVCAGSTCAVQTPLVVPISATGHDRFFGVTFDAQGNIYATGVVAAGVDATTDYAMVVAKFSGAGVLDTTYGENGFAIKNVAVGTNGELARGIVVQSNGKVVIAGTVEHAGAADARDRDLAVLRFDASGKLDPTFGSGGVAILDLSDGEVVGNNYVADSQWGLSVLPDDRLLVTGTQKRAGATDSDFALARLTADGKLDTTFATNGVFTLDIEQQNASARTATILADGSVLMSGYMTSNGVTMPVIFKVTPAGQLDSTFGMNGIFRQPLLAVSAEAYGAALQGSKLVTTGYGRNDANESLDFLSFRISSNGKIDPTYGQNGVARIDIGGFNDNARSMVVLSDSRVLLIGGGRPTANDVDAVVAILTPNGQTDESFAPLGFRTYDFGGPSDFFWGVALAPSKKYVAIVGIKGVGSNPGNDDAALVLLEVMP